MRGFLRSGRRFEFPVERAIFATVLHRIMVSGSDRACETWLSDYDIPGVDGLSLHHLYRAMAWLGEELPADEQGGATPLSPRTVKDRVEEELFARRRDLFSELSVVFFDTTSLSFTGAGGKSLGKRGYSKDHRPDLMQMIVGVVIDAAGRPVGSEMWPGTTADVTVLVRVTDRLRRRFAIGRVCVVADRGMICAATIARRVGSSTCSARASAPTRWCARSCSRMRRRPRRCASSEPGARRPSCSSRR